MAQNAAVITRFPRAQFANQDNVGPSKHMMVGQSKEFVKALALADKVAMTDSSVLLEGETGTGKEGFAQYIHRASRRHANKIVPVNCSAIPAELMESELFGCVRGAYTGANEFRPGLIASANYGTLFLDEISEMPIQQQAKLLRFLQERRFHRVGSNEEVRADVRVIAATNRNLLGAVVNGTFREDLYYRLGVVTIKLPALRERREDIPMLAEHFRLKIARENKSEVLGFSPEAMEMLTLYSWPGNIRQLSNVVERAVLIADGPFIQVSELSLEAASHVPAPKMVFPIELDFTQRGHVLKRLEKAAIIKALKLSLGVQYRAAKLLGISPRVIHYKIRRHGIDLDELVKQVKL